MMVSVFPPFADFTFADTESFPPALSFHSMTRISILILILSSAVSGVFSAFNLTTYRTINCVRGEAKFSCQFVGCKSFKAAEPLTHIMPRTDHRILMFSDDFCCKRHHQETQLFITFLSMSQSSPLPGDVQAVYRMPNNMTCRGSNIGADTFGCVDATQGIAYGGKVHSKRSGERHNTA